MNNKFSALKKTQKHKFLHIRTSCLGTDRATIPQINSKLHAVWMIFVIKKFRQIGYLELKLSCGNQFCLQNYSGRIKTNKINFNIPFKDRMKW